MDIKRILAALLAGVVMVGSLSACGSDDKASELLSSAERYLNEQEYRSAIIEFEKLLEIDPENVDAYLGIAEAHAELGNINEAIYWLEQGYELTDDSSLQAMISELSAPQDETTEQTDEPASTTTAAVTTSEDVTTTTAPEETEEPEIEPTDASMFEYEYNAESGGMVITGYIGDATRVRT